MENSLNQKVDGLQSEIGQKFDNLQKSISRLANQQVHQEEECLNETMVKEQCQQQLLLESSNIGAAVYPWEKKEAIPLLLTEEVVEERDNLPLPPNSVHILPSPASQSQPKTPEAPTIKANPSLSMLKNFKKLVATVQTFATTSKKMASAHIAWHSGWFGCWFRFGAPEPQHFYKLHQFRQPPKAKKNWFGGAQSPPLFVLIFIVLSYYYLFIYLFQ